MTIECWHEASMDPFLSVGRSVWACLQIKGEERGQRRNGRKLKCCSNLIAAGQVIIVYHLRVIYIIVTFRFHIKKYKFINMITVLLISNYVESLVEVNQAVKIWSY